MTFQEVYNRILPLWGDKIHFADGIVSDDNTGFRSKTLGILWDKVEREVGHEDTFGDLMVWTMYQVFGSKAIQLYREGMFELVPKDISKKEIEEQYFSNLNEEGWEEELADYERD